MRTASPRCSCERALNSCVVRPYEPGDRDAVNRIARDAFAEYEGAYEDWPSFIDGIGRMAELAQDGELLVAVTGGGVAGAVVHVRPGAARSPVFPVEWSVIRMLVVAPGCRGQGIGRRLAAACLRAALRDGAPAIGLHTSPVMATALRMYGALGFVRDRELEPIRGVPYGRYVLPAAAIAQALARLGEQPWRPARGCVL